MPNLTRSEFINFIGALQNAIYLIVKSQVPDGDNENVPEGAIVFPHLVAEVDKTKIESWEGAYRNEAGNIHAYSVGYGGIKGAELGRTLIGTVQPTVTFTIDGYYRYSHQGNSDWFFRDEVNRIYLELELQRKLNLPEELQSLLLKTETREFNHVLIPVGDKNKIHAAFGEITVLMQPIQIVG